MGPAPVNFAAPSACLAYVRREFVRSTLRSVILKYCTDLMCYLPDPSHFPIQGHRRFETHLAPEAKRVDRLLEGWRQQIYRLSICCMRELKDLDLL